MAVFSILGRFPACEARRENVYPSHTYVISLWSNFAKKKSILHFVVVGAAITFIRALRSAHMAIFSPFSVSKNIDPVWSVWSPVH